MVSNKVTLEQVEQLAMQLPPTERLKLMAHISEQLSAMSLLVSAEESERERVRMERLAEVDAWIAKCDKVAQLWEGEFDSAADLRRIRNEEI